MAKNPASETITHKFIADGSAYAKCKTCESYVFEGGRERCKKFDAFKPTLAFRCYKRDIKK